MLKNIFFAAFLLPALIFASCSRNANNLSDNNQNHESAKIDLAEVSYKCNTMHCTDCEKAISKSLKGIEGVQDVTSDFNTKIVKVKFDKTKTGKETIERTLTNAGYPPEPVN